MCILYKILRIFFRSRDCPQIIGGKSRSNKCINCVELIKKILLDDSEEKDESLSHVEEGEILSENLENIFDDDREINDDTFDGINSPKVISILPKKEIEVKTNDISDVENNSNEGSENLIKSELKTRQTHKFKCGQCSRTFSANFRMLQHMKKWHGIESKKFPCPQEGCNVSYNFTKGLVRHAQNVHNLDLSSLYPKPRGKLKCPDENCKKLFKSSKPLRKHALKVHGIEIKKEKIIKRFPCPDENCDESFQYEPAMAKHAGKVHGIEISLNKKKKVKIHCPFCEKVYKDSDLEKGRLLMHLKSVHASESSDPRYIQLLEEKEKTHICQVCGKAFTLLLQFNNHMRYYHPDFNDGKEKETCPICGKMFKCLKVHMEICKGTESLCVQCGKTFKNKIGLEGHIRMYHTNRESVSCSICSKKFLANQQLNAHMRRVHLDERPHQCKQCLKTFRCRPTLVSHVMCVHEKLKPFACEFCLFKCGKFDNLNLHRRKSHNAQRLTKDELKAMIEKGDHPHCDISVIANFSLSGIYLTKGLI